jgi:hypothetical protein
LRKDPASWRNSEGIPSWILDRLTLCSGVPSKKNSVYRGKNFGWSLSRMLRQSPSWSQLPMKFESVQMSWAVRIPRRVGPPLLSSRRGLREILNLWGGGYRACHHRPPRKSRIRRWMLFPPGRSCCWGPSSSRMQIRRKPLPGMPAVDVLLPIACYGGTRDSCSGFGVCWNWRLTQEAVDLYWFGPLWLSNSIYVQSTLAFALDWLLWSSPFLQGCP